MMTQRTIVFTVASLLAACASEQDPGGSLLFGDPSSSTAGPSGGGGAGGQSASAGPAAAGAPASAPMGDAGTVTGNAGGPSTAPPPAMSDAGVGTPRVPPTAQAGLDPFGAPPQCTSNAFWTRGTNGSSSMTPGQACIDCHSKSDEAPAYTIAGTVYPSGHEPDDCNGTSGRAGSPVVVVIGADGKAVDIPVNSVGNFFYQGRVALPYTTKVRNGANEIPMTDPATSGDCNSCHTQNGASGAPGRIVPPPP